jgi:hypothetical protein
MPVDRSAIAAQVEKAKNELSIAESALDQAIKDLNMRERASKEIIGTAMEAAFARLVAARTMLVDLEALINEG